MNLSFSTLVGHLHCRTAAMTPSPVHRRSCRHCIMDSTATVLSGKRMRSQTVMLRTPDGVDVEVYDCIACVCSLLRGIIEDCPGEIVPVPFSAEQIDCWAAVQQTNDTTSYCVSDLVDALKVCTATAPPVHQPAQRDEFNPAWPCRWRLQN